MNDESTRRSGRFGRGQDPVGALCCCADGSARYFLPPFPMIKTQRKSVRELVKLAYDEELPARPVWKRTGKGGRTWRHFRHYEPPGPLFDFFVMLMLVFSVLACLLI